MLYPYGINTANSTVRDTKFANFSGPEEERLAIKNQERGRSLMQWNLPVENILCFETQHLI